MPITLLFRTKWPYVDGEAGVEGGGPNGLSGAPRCGRSLVRGIRFLGPEGLHQSYFRIAILIPLSQLTNHSF